MSTSGSDARPPLPFGEQSRTGFELELLAPPKKSRRDLAVALALAFSGEVERGFKYHSEGPHRDGRPICDLTPAWRVKRGEEVLFTVVDDITITADLARDASTPEGLFRVVLDDLRLALWAERRCWGPDTDDPEALLRVLIDTFDAELGAPGEAGARDPRHRVVTDPWGHGLGVLALYEGERERAAELVTAPLGRSEREEVVGQALEVARAEGFTVPVEAALHLHLDRDPWMSSDRLCQLIEDSAAARSMLIEELKPNPRCRRLGPFPPGLVKLAQARRELAFEELKEVLNQTGVRKFLDINLLGILRARPVHPTLEVRCLPMSLHVGEVFEKVAAVEAFLEEVALSADARRGA